MHWVHLGALGPAAKFSHVLLQKNPQGQIFLDQPGHDLVSPHFPSPSLIKGCQNQVWGETLNFCPFPKAYWMRDGIGRNSPGILLGWVKIGSEELQRDVRASGDK